MVITVVNIFKNTGIFGVQDDTGGYMEVNAAQIFGALLNGQIFTNCHLTTKGFGIKTDTGIRYTQMKVNAQVRKVLNVRLEEQRLREKQEAEALKESKRIRHSINQIYVAPQKEIASLGLDSPKFTSKKTNRVKAIAKPGSALKAEVNAPKRAIVYKGNTFMSIEQLLKETGSGVTKEEFKRRWNIGYSMDECLGFIQMRPEDKVVPRSKQNKMIDSIPVNINS